MTRTFELPYHWGGGPIYLAWRAVGIQVIWSNVIDLVEYSEPLIVRIDNCVAILIHMLGHRHFFAHLVIDDNSNLVEIHLANLALNDEIRSQFCTCHEAQVSWHELNVAWSDFYFPCHMYIHFNKSWIISSLFRCPIDTGIHTYINLWICNLH